jgi:hypothetical protein
MAVATAGNEALASRNTQLEARVGSLEAENERVKEEARMYKLHSGNSISKLKSQSATWKRANEARKAAQSRRGAALREPVGDGGDGGDGGGGKRGWAETTDDTAASDISKQRAHNVVREMLGALKNASGGNGSTGARILQAFVNNGEVKQLQERLLGSDVALPGAAGVLQTDAMMVDRLVEAVTELKNSTSSTVNWHAYG